MVHRKSRFKTHFLDYTVLFIINCKQIRR